ncbi:MAG: hypothetical protein ACXWT3_12360 [Methylococcaceae bacterium]
MKLGPVMEPPVGADNVTTLLAGEQFVEQVTETAVPHVAVTLLHV